MKEDVKSRRPIRQEKAVKLSVAIVINRRSGLLARFDIDDLQQQVSGAFAEAGHRVMIEACEPQDLTDAVNRLPDHVDTLVVGGGDGTAVSAAELALKRGLTFGVIPLGTLNLFARDLGLPADPVRAARALATGRIAQHDVGLVNGQLFLTNAIMGAFPAMALRREQARGRGLRHWPRTLLEMAGILVKRPPARFDVLADGEHHHFNTHVLIVATDQYDEQLNLMKTRHAADDGRLYVYVGLRSGVGGFVRVFASIMVGRWRRDPLVREITAKTVVIDLKKKKAATSLDGEVRFFTPPLKFGLRANALTVLVPEKS